jgi:hypothetical protein
MVEATDRAAGAAGRPETELLLGCARTRLDAGTKERVQALLQQTTEWDYLLRQSLRHRVMPLLYWQLKTNFVERVPAPFMERLREHFYLNAARNLLLTKELGEILELFERNRIRAVPYKGPALAASVYGDVALRQFSDLDIFVSREEVEKASDLLRLRGYRKEHELDDATQAAFLKVEREHMFIRQDDEVYLDLHWGFVPTYFPTRLEAEALWSGLTPISLGDKEVLSFAPEDLLLILCLNAAHEGWDALVRFCDIAELIRAYPDLDWEQVTKRAVRARARRLLFLGLALAQDLLEAHLPDEVNKSLAQEQAVRRVARNVRRELFLDKREAGPVSQILKPARALDRLSDRARFYLRLGVTPTAEDWTFVKLPGRLRFLYYLTRPVRLARKYLWHRRKTLTKAGGI